MAPAENEPLPRTTMMGGKADSAISGPTVDKGTVARPPEDGQSIHASKSERLLGAADMQGTSVAASGPSNVARMSRVWVADPSLHHIVIVGGGAAGLELATK